MPATWGYGNGTIVTWGYANDQTSHQYDISKELLGDKYRARILDDKYNAEIISNKYHARLIGAIS